MKYSFIKTINPVHIFNQVQVYADDLNGHIESTAIQIDHTEVILGYVIITHASEFKDGIIATTDGKSLSKKTILYGRPGALFWDEEACDVVLRSSVEYYLDTVSLYTMCSDLFGIIECVSEKELSTLDQIDIEVGKLRYIPTALIVIDGKLERIRMVEDHVNLLDSAEVITLLTNLKDVCSEYIRN